MRIAVVFPGNDLEGFPGARNLIQGLTDRGLEVDVLLLRPQITGESRFSPAVSLIRIYRRTTESSGQQRVLGFFPSLTPVALRAIQRLRANIDQYRAVIGVDRPGLVLSWIAVSGTDTPLGSLLVEFYLPPKWRGLVNRVGNLLERWAYERCDIPIVQDATRAQFLSDFHGVDVDRVRILPNSPTGIASAGRSAYLHERFGVPLGRVVVLQAGVLDRGTKFDQVLEEARRFPPEWTMVFQSSRPLDHRTSVLWRPEDAPRILLNRNPLPYEDVEPLVRSATVGVALYRVLSKNTLVKGAAAGKVAMYLKCGVPVVFQDLPSFVPYVEGYGCGVIVREASEIRGAVRTILADYRRFSEGAIRCFDAEFALDDKLDDLAGVLAGQ